MTAESIHEKARNLEKQMSASHLVWDMDKVRDIGITHREFDVLQLVFIGLLNKEIGDFLGIACQTVKAHKVSISRKVDIYGGEIHLFNKLIDQGVVTFIPSVPLEQWIGIRKEPSKRN